MKNYITTKKYLLISLLFIVAFAFFADGVATAEASDYTGPTGIEYWNDIDSTGGGGITHDIGIDTTPVGTITLRGCYSATPTFSGYGFGAASFSAGIKGMIDLMGNTTPPPAGGFLPEGYYKIGPNNIDTCTDMTDYGSFYINSSGIIGSPITNFITALSPLDEDTGYNAWTNFAGYYSNDGTYTDIVIALQNLTDISEPAELKSCKTNIDSSTDETSFACHISLQTNTEYQWIFQLTDGTSLLPATDGAWTFTTGNVYQVTTPPVSEECEAFDVGCYLENAISWTFSIHPTTLNKFAELTLEDTLPFSYIYDLGNLWEELYDQEAENFEISIDFAGNEFQLISTEMLESISFQGLVRTLMGAIMLFFATLAIYKKIVRVHDAQHNTV